MQKKKKENAAKKTAIEKEGCLKMQERKRREHRNGLSCQGSGGRCAITERPRRPVGNCEEKAEKLADDVQEHQWLTFDVLNQTVRPTSDDHDASAQLELS